MTRAIRDMEKIHQAQIERARRKNERELKVMQSAHDENKGELKKAQAQEILDIQHAHHDQVSKVAQKKEKILSEMRTHLQQTKDLTDKELKALREYSEKETAKIQDNLVTKHDRMNSDNALYLEELNDRFNESASKIAQDGKNRIEQTKTNKEEEYRNTEAFLQNKLATQTDQFTTRYKQDAVKYQNLKDTQDAQFKKERIGSNLRQQTELSKMNQTHEKHLEQRDQNYRRGLKDQDKFFEQKYETQLTSHNEHFKRLEEKNKNLIDQLKVSLTEEISKTASRREDPFYQLETLKPRLKSFEDRVEVEVEIPDYSKQDLQLTIHAKEAILSFNRRFNDAVRLPDGTINKVNKVESFTTRVPTPHNLDPSSVKSSYEDGVMTYVIKKS